MKIAVPHRIIPIVFGRSSWIFGESIKASLKGATYPLSAAISFLEHDISSAWNVIKVGGSVREFSTYGTKDEDHVSTGKSWACFDSPYRECSDHSLILVFKSRGFR